MRRRLLPTVVMTGLILIGDAAGGAEAPVLRLEIQPVRPEITFLSWDTEGGNRVNTNLLRPGAGIRPWFRSRDEWRPMDLAEAKDGGEGRRLLLKAGEAILEWVISQDHGELGFRLAARRGAVEAVRIVFPFDPRVTPTTVLGAWSEDGVFELPAVFNAPDFGPLLVREIGGLTVRGRLEGSREKKTADIILELPGIAAGQSLSLSFSPLLLPPPEGLQDAGMWRWARRGWLNALQACARWGDQAKPDSAPAGILGNNVVSDPASVSVWFYADQAFWMPRLAGGISLAGLVRRTIDYWLDKRLVRDERGRLTGEVIGYWHYGNFLDANASPLIAAWDYVESTGDLAWLRGRVDRLELVANFLAGRDTDGDGLVEAVQTGNQYSLLQPNRSCAWWDGLNCGHKDGYANALIYRGWRSLADLESKLGRARQRDRYLALAEKLKAAYARVLFNPKTGWLAWWRSRDGELHDYASPTLNGLAIEYGLVEPEAGRAILDRLWSKLSAVGFSRFDLGVPPMLVPVRRGDYLQPNALGLPEREDGADTFGIYMNGGITAGQVLHFLAAHYVLGENDRADMVLRAMLDRQMKGGFQNGVRDAAMEGIDWTTWDGRPSGYEGYLADSFRFLQAVLLRERPFRERLYRPLH